MLAQGNLPVFFQMTYRDAKLTRSIFARKNVFRILQLVKTERRPLFASLLIQCKEQFLHN